MATISRWRAKRLNGEYLDDRELEEEAAELATLAAEDAAHRAQLSPAELAALEKAEAEFDAALIVAEAVKSSSETRVWPTNPLDTTSPPPIPTLPPPPPPEGFAYRFFVTQGADIVIEFGDLIPIEEVRRGEAKVAAKRAENTARLLALVEASLAEHEATPEPEPPPRRRVYATPLARQLGKIARKLHKSKHAFLQLDAKLLDYLLDGRRQPEPWTDEQVAYFMRAIGRAAPSALWPDVMSVCAASLSDVFNPIGRAELHRLAFEEACRRKAWSVAKKQAARVEAKQANHESALARLDDLIRKARSE